MSDPTSSAILPGAEAWSHVGNSVGVLVLHGFTGNPTSMRGLADAFADAGYSVEMPRLPGHGTTVEDMLTTNWIDWSTEAEAALERLASRTDTQVVAGLSMGGSLTVWLGTCHPELAGLICINPAAVASTEVRELVEALIAGGDDTMPGLGSDIAAPGVQESAYDEVPLKPLLSMLEAAGEISADIPKVEQPMLLFTSPQDHVVPPTDSDFLAGEVSGTVERVSCENSYHVATQDLDKEMIFKRSVAFVGEVTA